VPAVVDAGSSCGRKNFPHDAIDLNDPNHAMQRAL